MSLVSSYEEPSSQDSSVIREVAPRPYLETIPYRREMILNTSSETSTILAEEHSISQTSASSRADALLALFGRRTVAGDASLEEEIVARYAPVDQVQRILLAESPGAYTVFVWLDQPHYDEELMDKLLDAEEAILERHPQKMCEFHYVPFAAGHGLPFIPTQARLVWETTVYG